MRKTSAGGKPRLLWAIIALKIVKGTLFLASGVALALFRQEPSTRFLLRMADWADGDPRLHVTAHLLRELSTGFQMHFSAIVASCVIASGALFAEGIFLAEGYVWAPWLTIALTGFWLPLELAELAQRFRLRTLVVAVVNAAIVYYLFLHRGDFRRHLADDRSEI